MHGVRILVTTGLTSLALMPTASPAVAGRPDSGIRGKIMVAGICYPGPEPYSVTCPTYPVKATLRVLRASDREELRRVTSRKRDGFYQTRLKPGRYVLDPVDRGAAYNKGRYHVRVRKHEFTSRDVYYETADR